MNNKEIFLNLVSLERERQNKKFPNQQKQEEVSLYQWGTILGEEFGEFLKEVNDHDNLKAAIELAEVAAVCLRISEVFFSKETLEEAHQIMRERTLNQKAKE